MLNGIPPKVRHKQFLETPAAEVNRLASGMLAVFIVLSLPAGGDLQPVPFREVEKACVNAVKVYRHLFPPPRQQAPGQKFTRLQSAAFSASSPPCGWTIRIVPSTGGLNYDKGERRAWAEAGMERREFDLTG